MPGELRGECTCTTCSTCTVPTCTIVTGGELRFITSTAVESTSSTTTLRVPKGSTHNRRLYTEQCLGFTVYVRDHREAPFGRGPRPLAAITTVRLRVTGPACTLYRVSSIDVHEHLTDVHEHRPTDVHKYSPFMNIAGQGWLPYFPLLWT